MGGRARKIQVLIFFVPILRAEITDLPEIMTQPECRALFEIEEFLPDFGLVNDLEFDVYLGVFRAHLFGEMFEYSIACALDQRLPILLRARVEMSNGDKNVKRQVMSLPSGSLRSLALLAAKVVDFIRRAFYITRTRPYRSCPCSLKVHQKEILWL